ncbi:MAG TPA: hypothetical protein VGL72_16260, partial [Bryobacteraceae bacterium]
MPHSFGDTMTMRKLIAILVLLLGCAAAAHATTYYIDYASGSNSNSGTSKGSPWKSHPYMQNAAGCAGAPPSYTHVAGDQFIFKGGVTWPAACFPINITNGGTSGVQDYYGVDLTWFSGGSFTRPLFDLNYTPTNNVISASSGMGTSGYITFDNLEIAHQGITINTGAGTYTAYEFTFGWQGTIITNGYIHDWATSGSVGFGTLNYEYGGIDGYVTMDHTEMSDANGYFFSGATKITGVPFGGACHNCRAVQYSK